MTYPPIFMVSILLISSIIMFTSAFAIFFLGYKKKTPNFILWGFLPLFKGLEWLIEYISDYTEEILDKDGPFFYNRLEITFAFAAAFVILAACIEFNGLIEKPLGKIAAAIPFGLQSFYIWVLTPDTFDAIEDNRMFQGFTFISDPNRFSYGLLIPLIGMVVLLSLHLFYLKQVKEGKMSNNEKMTQIILISAILIMIPAIFNGFDYTVAEDVEDPIFLLFRGFTITLVVLLPLIIVLSSGLGLLKVIIVNEAGVPIYVYDFGNQKDVEADDKIILTSGFLSALVSFSAELAEKKSNLMSVRSSNLYYVLYKTKSHIFALQSLHYQKILDTRFFNAVQKIDMIVKTNDQLGVTDITQISSLIREYMQ